MKVKPTSTDSAGNGYYRGDDGNYYYGNTKNGYLKETRQTAKIRIKKEKAQAEREVSKKNHRENMNAAMLSSGYVGSNAAVVIGPILLIIQLAIATGIALAVSIVIAPAIMFRAWIGLYGGLFDSLMTEGLNIVTILFSIPLVLCLIVFIRFAIGTIKTQKLYIIQLVLSYIILCIPFGIMGAGGINPIVEGIVPISELIFAWLYSAINLSLFPVFVLVLLNKFGNKIQGFAMKVAGKT